MLGWLAFFGGIAYGYFSPGRQDLKTILMKGLLYGIVVAIVLALIGYFLNYNPLGFGGTGVVGLIISVVVIVLLFVLGAWIGDWLEHRKAPKTGTTHPRT